MSAAPESDIEVVTLSTSKRHRTVILLGDACEAIAEELKLTQMEMYFYAMYFVGGMAGANGVMPHDKSTFQQFREGYDDFHEFLEKNRRKHERTHR